MIDLVKLHNLLHRRGIVPLAMTWTEERDECTHLLWRLTGTDVYVRYVTRVITGSRSITVPSEPLLGLLGLPDDYPSAFCITRNNNGGFGNQALWLRHGSIWVSRTASVTAAIATDFVPVIDREIVEVSAAADGVVTNAWVARCHKLGIDPFAPPASSITDDGE